MSTFLPLTLGKKNVGWIHNRLVGIIARWPEAFAVSEYSVSIAPIAKEFATRSSTVERALRGLEELDLISGWRDEPYPVMVDWGDEPLMQIERAACPTLGIRAWGVHVNGYVRFGDGLHMWVARRAKNKPTYPRLLDNMVAGGQPIGISLRANVIKESQEEAGIPTEISNRAVKFLEEAELYGEALDNEKRRFGINPDRSNL